MQDAKIVPSKFTKLKNSSDVDMVVFGHDQDGSGEGPNQDMEDLEASPLFYGSAGVHTTDASLKNAAMWYGGPKGRRTTPLQHTASSTDQSFQEMQEGPGAPQANFKGSRPFEGAAGNVGTDVSYNNMCVEISLRPISLDPATFPQDSRDICPGAGTT